jgi:YD repeat-containing protein
MQKTILKIGVTFLSGFLSTFCVAQYYYNDVISTTLTNNKYLLLRQLKVQSVIAKAYSSNNELIDDFTLSKTINATTNIVVGTIKTNANSESVSTAEYENNKLIKTIEEGKKINLTVEYNYTKDGKLLSVTTNTGDTSIDYNLYETHLYLYNKKGIAIQMLKIKNDNDTTLINFVEDEQGNIGEERWIKNGKVVEQYYYYYDAKNRLTDIVRFNQKVQKQLPIEIFEYNDEGQVIKNIKIPFGNSNYTIWLYKYLPNGLIEKEYQYSKTNEFLGKLEYAYDY